MAQQQTIRYETEMRGTGLMFGQSVRVTLKPAPVGHGVVFRRTDLPGEPTIKVCPENHSVVVPRCTSLRMGEATVSSIEHLLSALAGLQIDNVEIDINAPEPPALDGSSLPYVRQLQQAEIVEQDAIRQTVKLKAPFAVHDAGKQLILLPAKEFRVSFVFDHPNVPTQAASFTINAQTYAEEIAPARSFCFADEIERLRSLGIGKGANRENVVVVEGDQRTSVPLRFPDEFVRHKILDIIGDLYLSGRLPEVHTIAMRTGHEFHAQLILALAENDLLEPELEAPVTAEQIYRVLPHRYPMCMLDRVLKFEPGKRAVGIKNLTYNEQFFQGHFPGQPVMPGVLQMEALAQLGAWLLLHENANEGQLGYFASIKEAKFRYPVVPGDQLRLEVEILRKRRGWAWIAGKAYVGTRLASQGELSIAVSEMPEK